MLSSRKKKLPIEIRVLLFDITEIYECLCVPLTEIIKYVHSFKTSSRILNTNKGYLLENFQF